mgnify:FL=1
MGSKPKKQDYKASAAEQSEARIGAQKAEFFFENYAPLNAAELNNSLSDDIKNLALGRGNADVMQGLTSKPTYAATQDAGGVASDLSGAYQATLGGATAGALDIQNKRGAAAVGASQKQSAVSASAGSLLTDIGTNRALDKAKNNELLRGAKLDAAMKVAGAGMDKMFPGTDKKPSLWKQYREAYKEHS